MYTLKRARLQGMSEYVSSVSLHLFGRKHEKKFLICKQHTALSQLMYMYIQYEHTFCTKHLEVQCCLPCRALKGRVRSVLTMAACNPPQQEGQGCTIPVKEQHSLLRHALTIMNIDLEKNMHSARNQFKRSRPVAHSFVLPVCTSVLQNTSFSARQSVPHTTCHPF